MTRLTLTLLTTFLLLGQQSHGQTKADSIGLQYKLSITKADSFFQSKNWEHAKARYLLASTQALYSQALGVFLSDKYPKDQIAVCDLELKKLASLIGYPLTIGHFSSGQTNDSIKVELQPYLNGYISLKGDSLLPITVKPYYSIIKNYFETHNLNVNHFFIRVSSVQADSSKVTFELYHINSFTKRKWIDEENERLKKEQPPKKIDIVGNLSGQDGVITIDSKKNVVISFIKWE